MTRSQRHGRMILGAVAPWRARGYTLDLCCRLLDAIGARTVTGRTWKAGRLSRVLRRAAAEAEDEAVLTGDPELLDLGMNGAHRRAPPD